MNYFYNGIKLPEFDFAAHPNALIVQFVENGNYGLICPSSPFWIVNHNGGEVIAISPEADVDVFTCASGDSIWQQTDSQFEPEPGAIWVSLNPSTYQYIWTKADISRENSTQVVYSGSDPVEEVIQEHNWLGSFKTGLSLGLCGKPLPLPLSPSQKEPVAFLYNGAQFPPLPEWDREMYPYVHIYARKNLTMAFVRITSMPVYHDDILPDGYNGPDQSHICASSDGIGLNYRYGYDGKNDWEPSDPLEVAYMASDTVSPVGKIVYTLWTNTDIYNPDGSLHLAASDPIPVYEEGVN